MSNKTNWLAIIVAAVAGMAIGFLWYGVLFQNQWMAGNGITMEGDKAFKNGVEMPMSALPMVANMVAMLVYAYFMSWLAGKTGHTTFSKAATLGGIIGLILLISVFTNNLFSADTALTGVDGSYALVLFIVIGTIAGGWRKK